jgi:NMD protein affecting ribosome stability and mRNA decay
MAVCKKCGAKFGCGCQLINGLCAACNAATKQGRKLIGNVITQAYKLSRVR